MSYYAAYSDLILFILTCLLKSERADFMQIARRALIWPSPFAKNIQQIVRQAMNGEATENIMHIEANNVSNYSSRKKISCLILNASFLSALHIVNNLHCLFTHDQLLPAGWLINRLQQVSI